MNTQIIHYSTNKCRLNQNKNKTKIEIIKVIIPSHALHLISYFFLHEESNERNHRGEEAGDLVARRGGGLGGGGGGSRRSVGASAGGGRRRRGRAIGRDGRDLDLHPLLAVARRTAREVTCPRLGQLDLVVAAAQRVRRDGDVAALIRAFARQLRHGVHRTVFELCIQISRPDLYIILTDS